MKARWIGALATLALAHPAAATVCDTYSISSATCYGPNNGRLGDVTTQATFNGDQLDGYSCATLSQDGFEKSVPFTCHYNNFVTLQVEATSTVIGGCDTDFFLLGDTCDPVLDCLDGNEDVSGPGRVHSFTFWCEQGRQYYVVAENDPRARADNPGTFGNDQICFEFISPAGGRSYGSQFTVKPFCTESCTDGFDNDRDSLVDCSDSDCTAACCDQDGDGVPSTSVSCGGDDCNDRDPFVNPFEIEVPADRVDQDCDGLDDCYIDADRDGFGSTATAISNDLDCTDPNGEADDDDDCDDGDPLVRPGVADPPADGVDQDCTGGDMCYVDADRDGYGGASTLASVDLDCADPGEADAPDDCDDASGAISPAVPEIAADGVDQDCDLADDCWQDLDGDRFGAPIAVPGEDLDCADLPGQSNVSTDCLDVGGGAVDIYPGAPELPVNGVDEDCDGADDCYADQDGDGFAGAGAVPGDDLVCGDGDGLFDQVTDCLDAGVGAAAVRPGAPELCNGFDDDCDGLVDGDDPDGSGDAAWYPDDDGDGYGRSAGAVLSCTAPPGYSPSGDDCDDLGPDAARVYPGAAEVPADGIDQDCDGADHCWLDADGDGFGGPTSGPGDDRVCGDLAGESSRSDDCLDVGPGAVDVYPTAVERCNGRDDDCDGSLDDDDADRVGGATWYRDADGDGYAGDTEVREACLQPVGYLASPTDCLDVGAGAALINPAAAELPADGVDQDCDGDDDCWSDQDGDGFGTPTPVPGGDLSCGNTAGESNRSDDCLDVGPGAAATYPGAAEVCNGGDDDCDGLADDADSGRQGGALWYGDLDGDGYAGAVSTARACVAPAGFREAATDCLDSGAGAALTYPGAPETPVDNLDQDCDGVDACYVDADRDGFGGASTAPGDNLVCGDADGEALRPDDCLDEGPGAAEVFPGAPERCNTRDDDCDRLIDDADIPVDPATWYGDGDGDGFAGDVLVARACQAPPGYAAEPLDCDDARRDRNPLALEVCNQTDDDCDGLIDAEDAVGASLPAWVDGDGDGYGDPDRGALLSSCDLPAGYAANDDDCDDARADVAPQQPELPYDGVDQDCSGGDLVDVDGDGAPGGAVGNDCADRDPDIRPGLPEVVDGVDQDCDRAVDEGTIVYDDDGDGYAELGGDCDDAASARSPAAVELCDGVDQDCDGVVDEGTSCYDDDGDGLSEDQGDCHDGDPAVRPGAPEGAVPGVDADCDGRAPALEIDGDGFSVAGGDCNDRDAAVRPGAPETLDGVDEDCDGLIDDGTAAFDDDRDGLSEAQGDCNDADPAMGPSATELTTNRRDDDCDGQIDEGSVHTDDDGDGWTEDGGDCDDAAAAVHPGATDTSGGGDDDCDGEEERLDADGDGWTPADGDCDDDDGWRNPGLEDQCNGSDDNCDSQIDEGCVPEVDDKDPGETGSCGCASSGQGGWALLVLLGVRRRSLRPASPAPRARGW